MPNTTNCGASPVLALELDRNGNVSKKTMKLDREAQLNNSLLHGLYPGIHVATVDVPTEPLDSCEQAMVEQALICVVGTVAFALVPIRAEHDRETEDMVGCQSCISLGETIKPNRSCETRF